MSRISVIICCAYEEMTFFSSQKGAAGVGGVGKKDGVGKGVGKEHGDVRHDGTYR